MHESGEVVLMGGNGGGGGRSGRGGGGGGGMPTESGRPASEIPVTMSIGGNTYAVKDDLKARGYKYELGEGDLTKEWHKEMSLADARKETQDLVDRGIIKAKSVTPNIRGKRKSDGRDVYFYNKKYISPLW